MTFGAGIAAMSSSERQDYLEGYNLMVQILEWMSYGVELDKVEKKFARKILNGQQ